MPKDIQIGADVARRLRDRVRRYAQKLQLPESALITLLVARELRLKRLRKLPPSTAVKRMTRRSRLTGRQSSPELRDRFRAHVGKLQIDLAVAVATLAEQELREKWLRKSLAVTMESN
jgi:hypothetical protein